MGGFFSCWMFRKDVNEVLAGPDLSSAVAVNCWLGLLSLVAPLIDTLRVWNEADQRLAGSTLYFTVYNGGRKKKRSGKVLKYFKANKWLVWCVWCSGLEIGLYNCMCQWPWERQRDKRVCLQRWKVSILNISIRAIQKRMNTTRWGLFKGEKRILSLWWNGKWWPEGQKHNAFIKICLFNYFCVCVTVQRLLFVTSRNHQPTSKLVN